MRPVKHVISCAYIHMQSHFINVKRKKERNSRGINNNAHVTRPIAYLYY
jgi:hypothetical protein